MPEYTVAIFNSRTSLMPESPLGDCHGRLLAGSGVRVKRKSSKFNRPNSGLPVPNSPCGFCGRKATLNLRQSSKSCVSESQRLKQQQHIISLTPDSRLFAAAYSSRSEREKKQQNIID